MKFSVAEEGSLPKPSIPWHFCRVLEPDQVTMIPEAMTVPGYHVPRTKSAHFETLLTRLNLVAMASNLGQAQALGGECATQQKELSGEVE